MKKGESLDTTLWQLILISQQKVLEIFIGNHLMKGGKLMYFGQHIFLNKITYNVYIIPLLKQYELCLNHNFELMIRSVSSLLGGGGLYYQCKSVVHTESFCLYSYPFGK